MSTISEIRSRGYKIARGVFSSDEIALVKRRVEHYSARGFPGIVHEKDGAAIRALHGMHLHDEFFRRMFASSRLLTPAQQFLGEPCYVHQSKINVKQRKVGARWPWHQDFIYWHRNDGIAVPDLINLAVLLDEATEDNGPLCMIPCSHSLAGLTDIELRSTSGWHGNVSEDLTYQISEERIKPLIDEHGLVFFTGQPGDMLLFDSLLAHCSAANTSSKNRALLIITYNACSNPARTPLHAARPEFLCARSMLPIELVPYTTLHAIEAKLAES